MNDFLDEWHNASNTVEAHTSGSTGKPKRIELLKSDMRASAEATINYFGINRESILAIPLSADYIAGKMMAVRADMAGCRLLELPVSNTVSIDTSVDLLAVVPSQIPSLLESTRPTLVKNLLIGGAPLSDDMESRIVAAGFNAYIGYGMTETCSHVALRKLGEDGSFKAMDGISFSTDSRGCLVIHSSQFSWKELVTNDMVELVSSQSFKWLGRADNVVISGGLKLHPELLEKEYARLIPGLPPFYLTGEANEKWGQCLVMVAENPSEGLLEQIRLMLDDRRKAPQKIVAVEELPRTANGKVRRILP